MQSARDKAKKTVILSDLGQSISAIRTCFADEENLTRPPAGANPTFSVGGGPVCAGSSATWPIVNRDGLDYYRFIVPKAWENLTDNGLLVLEIGHTQAESVVDFMKRDSAYQDIQVVQDYSGYDRVVLARKRTSNG